MRVFTRGVTGAAAILSFAAIGFTATAEASEPVANWQETAVKSFRGLEGTTKSQGLASDGSQMYFSWNFGLHSTGLEMDPPNLAENQVAIPQDLSLQGANHIGDIDYYDGTIYAPIEDGHVYLHPTIVPFDAQTLEAGPERYPLDTSKLTDGVPWIAIDADRQVAYTTTWNETTSLNVHRLSDFAITSTVQLDQPVSRIQGAKVYKGNLYAARDNGPEKSIIAIDPTTGHVTHLFDRNLGDQDEAEGIAFVKNSGGTTMRTTDIVESDGSRVDVHSYRINGDVTPPVLTSRGVVRKRVYGTNARIRVTSSEPVTANAGWLRCIGARKHPCRRTREMGPVPLPGGDSIQAGKSIVSVPCLKTYAPKTGSLHPGFYRLKITPTDVADAVGPTITETIHVLWHKH